MRNSWILIMLMSCSTAFAQRKALTPSEVALFKENVATSTRNVRSLQSDFTQTKQLSYMENAITSSGKLYFKAPRQIRWEYRQPTRHVIIFDNQVMHTQEAGDKKKQVNLTSNSRLKGLNDFLVGTVQGGKILDESRFDIRYYRDGTTYLASMVPKERTLDKYIKQVELTFSGDTFLLQRVKIVDPAQDYTVIAFENQQKNTALPADTFALK